MNPLSNKKIECDVCKEKHYEFQVKGYTNNGKDFLMVCQFCFEKQ